MGKRYYSSGVLRKATDKKGEPWKGILSYKTEEGKWRQKTRYFRDCKKKTDARVAFNSWWDEMETEAQARLAEGKPIQEKPRKTVEDAIRDYLAEEYRLRIISKGTYQTQLRKTDLQISDYFQGADFYALTSEDIADFISSLCSKYKPQSVRTLYSIVAKTYANAMRRKLISINPCDYAVLPSNGDREINYLDAEGRKKFLVLLDREPRDSWRYFVGGFVFYTGMRTSEMCGLQPRDINRAIKNIAISRSAVTVKNDVGKRVVEVKEPKSKAGKRNIPLLPQAEEILDNYLDALGREIAPNDFLVEEKYRNPSNICANFLSWTRKNGIIGSLGKPITLHGLRHTFATMGVESGMDIKSLSSILGHARADMTLNIYASDDEQAKKIAMGRMGDYLSQSEEDDL